MGTVYSNLGLERFLGERRLSLERTAVGDRYVMARMREGGFNLGGEQSGHMILSDFSTTGDGLIAGLQVLAVLVQSDQPMSRLARQFEPVPQKTENVRFANGAKPLDDASVKAAIADGEARLNACGRIVVRPSGTEPLIRIMAEGDDAKLVAQVVRDIAGAVKQAATAEALAPTLRQRSVAEAVVAFAITQAVRDGRLVHGVGHSGPDAVVGVFGDQAGLVVQVIAETHRGANDARMQGPHAPGRAQVQVAVVDRSRLGHDLDRRPSRRVALHMARRNDRDIAVGSVGFVVSGLRVRRQAYRPGGQADGGQPRERQALGNDGGHGFLFSPSPTPCAASRRRRRAPDGRPGKQNVRGLAPFPRARYVDFT